MGRGSEPGKTRFGRIIPDVDDPVPGVNMNHPGTEPARLVVGHALVRDLDDNVSHLDQVRGGTIDTKDPATAQLLTVLGALLAVTGGAQQVRAARARR